MTKELAIRNSTVEFLVFTAQAGEESIEVKYADGTIWLTQKKMAELFDVEVNTINYHLKEIFKTNELDETSTIRKIRIVQKEVIPTPTSPSSQTLPYQTDRIQTISCLSLLRMLRSDRLFHYL